MDVDVWYLMFHVQWASGYEAYDRLSPAYKRFLEGLTAVHNADFFIDVRDSYQLPFSTTHLSLI